MRLRLKENMKVCLDYANGTGRHGLVKTLFYGNPDHQEWLPLSMFGDDGTIGPCANLQNAEAERCCLGYDRREDGSTHIKMVRRDDQGG